MTRAALGLVLAGAPAAIAAAEQLPQVKRSVLQRQSLRAPGEEGVMVLVEIPPGGREGRHAHPAEAFAYVIEGTLTLDLEGEPSRTFRAGESAFIPAGKVHEGINSGDGPVKLVATFVADKGKPLTTPAK